MQKFYHVTKKEYLETILKNGLKPSIGDNSLLAQEDTPRIYLCAYDDIPYWKILLNADVVLEISNLDRDFDGTYEYEYYSEYITTISIPAEHITVMDYTIDTTEYMQTLCIDVLHRLSTYLMRCAQYYDREKDIVDNADEIYDALKQLSRLYVMTLPRLNYQTCDTKLIESELRYRAEDCCEYTLCDEYHNTGERLWTQVKYYPKDDLYDSNMRIYEYIRNNLADKLEIDTGGWTG